MKKIIPLIALFILLAGCRTTRTTIEVPVYIHDTTEVKHYLHDSTYIDRWRTEYVKGDTIYRTDSITHYRYLYKIDTAYFIREVPIEVEKVVEVEKTPSHLRYIRLLVISLLVGASLSYIIPKLHK